MQKTSKLEPQRPRQKQARQPGIESKMKPRPQSEPVTPNPGGRLESMAALISGGDSGIGRAVAAAFAREGADVGIVYLDEHDDANETRRMVESYGRRCVLIAGDVGDEDL